MSVLRSSPFRLLSVLLAAASVAFVTIAAFVPVPATFTQTTEEGATIYFTTSDQLLLHPSDCATIAWDSANIQSIRVNGAPTIGTFEVPYCPADSSAVRPYMVVNLPNGTDYTYDLPTLILTESVPLHAALAVVGALLLVAFVPLPSVPAAENPSRRHFLQMGGIVLAFAALSALGVTVYRRKTQPDIVICNGWVVRSDELRAPACGDES